MHGRVSNDASKLLEALHEGVQVIDHAYRYAYVNPAAARHGKTVPDKLLGRTMMECYPGIDATPMFGLIRRCLEDGTSHVIENAFLFPDNELRWFELRIEPVEAGACVLSLDVTDRKLHEAARRARDRDRARASRERELPAGSRGVIETLETLIATLETAAPRSSEVDALLARARARVEAVRAYGQVRPLSRRRIAPSVVLSSLASELARGEISDVSFELADELGSGLVDVDPDEVVFAAVAIVRWLRERSAGSAVAVTLARHSVTEEDALIDSEETAGEHARFTIRTSGRGFDTGLAETLFIPELSITSASERFSLDMAGARGIVRQNGGALSVRIWPDSIEFAVRFAFV